ncbi:MAG TPA: hypothetical protein VJ204_11075 [Solirubrobacterales bacterium]|nr:hypothetical protein [Solirubrobacterales bacterium]
MSISQLRDDVREELVDFLWDEWGQMGVSASTSRRDSWATDPEALLLLTFEVGRGEPRLFEEVLDWMLVNERLLSVQRLRNLAVDDADRALVEAVVGWLGENHPRFRLAPRPGNGDSPRPFFRGGGLKVSDPDPAFLAQGFVKPRSKPSGKSQAPDLALPINFAFRLRMLMGVSVRAEVARALLTIDTPWMNAQALAESTAYTKRNVREAATSLASVGLVRDWTVGNENRFGASDRWADFLAVGGSRGSKDWPQLFRVLRQILRWLDDPTNRSLSDYMLLSGARTLLEGVGPDLRFAGIAANVADATRDFASFESFVRDFLSVVR